jgi:hypothetical protein
MIRKPKGRSASARHSRTVAVLIAFLVLAVLALGIGRPWILTETAIRRFMADGTRSLTEEEMDRVASYILAGGSYEHPFRHRPFGLAIPQDRQSRLIQAAIDRTEHVNDNSIHFCIEEKYTSTRGRMFPDLPKLQAQAIQKGVSNAYQCVTGDALDVPDNIANHLDLSTIFSSNDSQLILACLISFKADTLWKHRATCLGMLKRQDLKPYCKRALLEIVARGNLASSWFSDQEDLLEDLGQSNDPEIEKWVSEVRQQISDQTEKDHNNSVEDIGANRAESSR